LNLFHSKFSSKFTLEIPNNNQNGSSFPFSSDILIYFLLNSALLFTFYSFLSNPFQFNKISWLLVFLEGHLFVNGNNKINPENIAAPIEYSKNESNQVHRIVLSRFTGYHLSIRVGIFLYIF